MPEPNFLRKFAAGLRASFLPPPAPNCCSRKCPGVAIHFQKPALQGNFQESGLHFAVRNLRFLTTARVLNPIVTVLTRFLRPLPQKPGAGSGIFSGAEILCILK